MKTIIFLAALIILLLISIILILIWNYKLSCRIRENELLQTLAYTDALTGVYNRMAYNSHILELNSIDDLEYVGIILFDIDNFKIINDSKGHMAGDAVLKMVAKTLKKVFPAPENNVYRIGGDEFAVISKNITETQLIELLIKLRKNLKKESDIRLSNGYSITKGNINMAFKYADEMLYADKNSKK